MAFILADRVKQTATTTGTGAFTLSATPTGFRAFSSVLAVGDTMYYTIAHQTANEWEVGYGTYSASNTLTRTKVISSSNSGSAVNFSAGTKDVFVTLPAMGTFGTNLVLGTAGTLDQNTTDRAVALGYGTTVSQQGGIAVGYSANAGGASAQAIGYGATSAGNYGLAYGTNASAAGSYGVAIGNGSSAGLDGDVAIGGQSNNSYGTAVGYGSNANINAVAIGSSTTAATQNAIVIGRYAYTLGTGSQDIAIGSGSYANDDAIVFGHGSSSDASAGDNIVIGNNLNVSVPSATFMNKFRIDPTTFLVGPAYTLTYDSTTHEVYAVTGSGPGGGFDWVTHQESGLSGSITAPANYTISPMGPAYASLGGAINQPWTLYGAWSGVSEMWSSGSAYYLTGMNWSLYPSPVTYSSPPASSGMTFFYVQYPAGHSLSSYNDVWGNISSWSSSYGSSIYLPSAPSSGSTKKMYGVVVIESYGTDLTSSISGNPSYPSFVKEVGYSNYAGATIVYFEITNTSEVSNLLSMGGTPFAWGPSSYNYFGHVWYEWS